LRWSEAIEASNNPPLPDASPIVPLDPPEVRDPREAPVTRWLDVDHGIVFSSPPLIPVATTARHVVAMSTDEPAVLWHLDFARGEMVRIGQVACTYRSVDVLASRVLLDCPAINGGGEAASTDDTVVELLDLAASTRTVVKGLIGGRLLPRGAILISRFYDADYEREMKRGDFDRRRQRPVPQQRFDGLMLLP
jgi:hypothetical protein